MDAAGEILICTAVELEAKAIARRLKLKYHGRGMWGEGSLILANVGMGVSHGERIGGVANVIIGAGLGGALDPRLKIGAVVLDDADGVLGGVELPAIERGPIHTAGAIVASPEAKAALFSQTGAMAVDMETAVLRFKAREMGAKFIAVRGISDEAGETLDPVMARIVDDEGRPKVWAIAKELAKRPGLGGELRALGRKAALAADRMAEVVAAICTALGARDADAGNR